MFVLSTGPRKWGLNLPYTSPLLEFGIIIAQVSHMFYFEEIET